MFDIGWSELVVIAVVALIAIGPKELPGVLRSIGHWMGKIRHMASEFQSQFQEAMREAEMADLKKTADELNDATKSLTAQLNPLDDLEKSAAELMPSTSGSASATAEVPAALEAAPVAPPPVPPAEPASEPAPALAQAPEATVPAAKGAV